MKTHPWFQDFDWNKLQEKSLLSSFKPNMDQENFDNTHVNLRVWNDDQEVQEHSDLLRRASQKVVFEPYYFDIGKMPRSDRNETQMPTAGGGEDDDYPEGEIPQEDYDNDEEEGSNINLDDDVGTKASSKKRKV